MDEVGMIVVGLALCAVAYFVWLELNDKGE